MTMRVPAKDTLALLDNINGIDTIRKIFVGSCTCAIDTPDFQLGRIELMPMIDEYCVIVTSRENHFSGGEVFGNSGFKCVSFNVIDFLIGIRELEDLFGIPSVQVSVFQWREIRVVNL